MVFTYKLCGANEHQETNKQNAAIGTRIVFCPEKFVMLVDITKRRMKLVIEATTTRIYGEKKETLEKCWI